MWYIISGMGGIAAALMFIAIGMRIANENNKRAWEKYYEGQNRANGNRTSSCATQYTANVVPILDAQRKAR